MLQTSWSTYPTPMVNGLLITPLTPTKGWPTFNLLSYGIVIVSTFVELLQYINPDFINPQTSKYRSISRRWRPHILLVPNLTWSSRNLAIMDVTSFVYDITIATTAILHVLYGIYYMVVVHSTTCQLCDQNTFITPFQVITVLSRFYYFYHISKFH